MTRCWRQGGGGFVAACIAIVAIAAVCACAEEKDCEPLPARPFDARAGCLQDLVATDVSVCLDQAEKGVGSVCLVSPEGSVHATTINLGAHLEGGTWSYGDAISKEHAQKCQQAEQAVFDDTCSESGNGGQ